MTSAPIKDPSPLTPQMRSVLDRIERAHRPAFHTMSARLARFAYESASEVLEFPRAPLLRVEDVAIPVGGGVTIPARLYANSRERVPVMLYLHGGGFTIGSLETHDSLCRQLALRSGAAVLAVAYRLAPDHPFPVAVDDCWAALHWLAVNAESLGLDARRIAVGGDSAGGTLAAVCALHARDVGMALGLQVLITPGTAAFDDFPSRATYASGYLLDAVTIEWFFGHYLDRHRRMDWRFAPLQANDLEGVAPVCLVLAECDPLVDEGLAYGDRLRSAGVPVQLELLRGVTHDFIKMGRALPEAGAAQAAIGDALKRAWTA